VKVYLIVTQGFELWKLGIARFHISPSFALALSFLALIGVGTGMLLDRRATPPVKPISPVDALFTATSAACVTGLTVRDTGTEFTSYGQTVILALIQVGGLGIMTFAAFFASLFGRGLSVRDQVLVREMLQAEAIGRLPQVLAFILISTMVAEGAGAALLYFFDPSPDPGSRVWYAAFHAISAFCNAGFGLYADNLGRFERQPAVLATVAGLIVMGGLGYVVVFDLVRGFLRAIGRLFRIGRRARRPRRPVFSLQSRLVLLTSVLLIVAGGALLTLYDGDNSTFAGLTMSDKIANATFLSISCRTAGFNVAPIGVFTTGSLFVMMALMFIGGSPGSTAGGIKTTTFAVLTSRVLGLLRHREEIEVFGRTLPRRLIANAIGIVFIQFGLIFVVTLALLYTDPKFRLEQTLFEVVSAFGTVGLSTGITAELSTPGKLLITLAMFTGRIGPLTLIFAMAEQSGTQAIYRYPDGKVMIG
jgi:trk system potassium uptake protein